MFSSSACASYTCKLFVFAPIFQQLSNFVTDHDAHSRVNWRMVSHNASHVTLLSPDKNAFFMVGVRQARRGPPNVVTSWGPLVDLNNNNILALLAKTLASVSNVLIIMSLHAYNLLAFNEHTWQCGPEAPSTSWMAIRIVHSTNSPRIHSLFWKSAWWSGAALLYFVGAPKAGWMFEAHPFKGGAWG